MTVTNDILRDYLCFNSTRDIADKYCISQDEVKIILKRAMPLENYLRVARVVGAKKTSEKLKNHAFRKLYSEKMKLSVSSAIKNKMNSVVFRNAWIHKAKRASVKGNQKIKQLLSDETFSKSWSAKCSLGARTLISLGKGIFDPNLKTERINWSIAGLKKTGRKVKGPLDEKMYNDLEVQVAKLLLSLGFTYSYGKVVRSDNLNGFFSIDFVVNGFPIIIEVTYWDKIEAKCLELERKFREYKNIFPNYSFIVTTTPAMCDYYKRFLPDNILVLTPKQLEHFMAGFRQSKRSGVTDSTK